VRFHAESALLRPGVKGERDQQPRQPLEQEE
jgi:hypothetical protein